MKAKTKAIMKFWIPLATFSLIVIALMITGFALNPEQPKNISIYSKPSFGLYLTESDDDVSVTSRTVIDADGVDTVTGLTRSDSEYTIKNTGTAKTITAAIPFVAPLGGETNVEINVDGIPVAGEIRYGDQYWYSDNISGIKKQLGKIAAPLSPETGYGTLGNETKPVLQESRFTLNMPADSTVTVTASTPITATIDPGYSPNTFQFVHIPLSDSPAEIMVNRAERFPHFVDGNVSLDDSGKCVYSDLESTPAIVSLTLSATRPKDLVAHYEKYYPISKKIIFSALGMNCSAMLLIFLETFIHEIVKFITIRHHDNQ